ncbi:MAG: integrase domain-containing protein [Gammaproteobacteria bacterium]|nr:integrase domain-containing protein [Gammaproteobacteria bacterium]MBU1602053.1 integrase domain-containing protein [Gammaproteobacteria bacterium]MBU2434029.1 integrase domain-containing protein [Gammaproteobacteria bacterium]MBU2447853.1 integrase domain-containing protein [Gammaproteobacteria bacterium]
MSNAIPSNTVRRISRRRLQEPASPGRSSQQQPVRPQGWAGKTPKEILARYQPGKAPPLKVLEVLIKLFNTQHTALEKTVSHKTRQERAQFLRRFFRDLKIKAGFKTVPDPRNLGQKHIHAMVQVWQQAHLAPATIQTYLSFLRGLAMWMGKHGFVRKPSHYGLSLEEYQRQESAQRDKGWAAQGIDIDALVAKVGQFDRYVGASLRLIQAMGLRRKESVQFRPFESIVPFEETGKPLEKKAADRYVRIKGKGGRVRHIPLDSPNRLAAVEFAQGVVASRDAHMGDPAHTLKQNLRRFDYVLAKFGITERGLRVTGHGLRHEVLIQFYSSQAGEAPPVRGGGPLPPDVDRAARQAVSELAGHARTRAAGAYCGPIRRQIQPETAPNDRDAPGLPPA